MPTTRRSSVSIQAGAIPITWIALLQELQRDWSRTETAEEVFRIGREHGGSWGQGIVYHDRAVRDGPEIRRFPAAPLRWRRELSQSDTRVAGSAAATTPARWRWRESSRSVTARPIVPIPGVRTNEQLSDNPAALDLNLTPAAHEGLDRASAAELGFPHGLRRRTPDVRPH